MRHLDIQVIEQALQWAQSGQALWLCTVLSTYGSAPRAPGAMLVANAQGQFVGSLSGGCVEDEFRDSLVRGELLEAAQIVRYGENAEQSRRLQLPCGGMLIILVEHRPATTAWIDHLRQLQATLLGQHQQVRHIDLTTGLTQLEPGTHQSGERVSLSDEQVRIRVGPALRLILAGLSPVAEFCASFGRAIGCEVIACDPREEMLHVQLEGVEMQRVLPSMFIAAGGCHSATAVVALTHDPKIDDLALMEAVHTSAFYIGAMGSKATSAKRAERLKRIGGLDDAQIARLHMPIGLNLGSKSPAEIALAVMADVLRVYHGKPRNAL